MSDILLRRKHKIILEKFVEQTVLTPNTECMHVFGDNNNLKVVNNSKIYVITIMKNVESLGYTFSVDLIQVLMEKSLYYLESFHSKLICDLRKLVGDDVVYRPMYPNFPRQVINANKCELIFNALIHYASGGILSPAYEKEEREILNWHSTMKAIGLGSEDDLMDIANDLIASKSSLSDQDKSDLRTLFKELPTSYLELDNISYKENVALIGALIIQNNPLIRAEQLTMFKTATDVLRLAVELSKGDVSLATPCKFRSFKRRERRLLLELLDNCNSIEEDMVRFPEYWKRLGEKLHPSEYNYVYVNSAFDKLRNGIKVEKFGGKIARLLRNGDLEEALITLKTRPGEYARMLDYLLREYRDTDTVLYHFSQIANKVSTPVLWQALTHFRTRGNMEDSLRVFFPKGNIAKLYCIPEDRKFITSTVCSRVVSICADGIIKQYSDRSSMDNVYLSESFKNYLVPFSQRSASKSLKTIVRGSRIKIADKCKIARSFIWWTNNSADHYDRIDIDLSSVIFDEDWNYLAHTSYTNLADSDYKCYHSGDKTNGGPVDGEGVAEFIDVDMDSVISYGGRYLVFQVYSYTNDSFASMPNCRFGWMEREDMSSGEIFEPKTVKQYFNLTSDSTTSVTVILDCATREYIWCDMTLSIDRANSRPLYQNNLECNLSNVAIVCRAIVNLNKANLYDLISANVKARGGRLVSNPDLAELVFDEEQGITPFETEVFTGQYL